MNYRFAKSVCLVIAALMMIFGYLSFSIALILLGLAIEDFFKWR